MSDSAVHHSCNLFLPSPQPVTLHSCKYILFGIWNAESFGAESVSVKELIDDTKAIYKSQDLFKIL